MSASELVIRDVEVDGTRVDVRVRHRRITDVRAHLDDAGAPQLDGAGAALLPGLHDHHLHLLASAAAATSCPAGPPDVRTGDALRTRLQQARPRQGWIRAVGYDEAVAGALDRHDVDALRGDVAVRIQHRSGALWVLNSAAIQALGLDGAERTATPAGVERDAAGRVTGRIWRLDSWLCRRLGSGRTDAETDLRALGERLTAYGITGVTDATPELGVTGLRQVAEAHADGRLPQRITILAADLTPAQIVAAGLHPGPAKIVIADHALPGLDELTGRIRAARAQRRAVAMHAVTREALIVAVAALDEVGPQPGDRIEHAAVAAPESVGDLARLGVRVVTQPSFVALRGGDYLDRVEPDDRAHLWPFARLLAAGIPVAASSDAPYGSLDPWVGIRAARDRRTDDGRTLVARERVAACAALAAYLGPLAEPGGRVRRVRVGAPADLVLLDASLRDVLADPAASRVRATIVGGRVLYEAERDGCRAGVRS